MKVRAATMDDLEALLDHGIKAFQMSAISQPVRDLTRAMGRGVIARGLAIIIEDDEGSRILGSIGLVKRTWEHSGLSYLTDRWTCADDPRAFPELVHGARMVATRLKLQLMLGVWGALEARQILLDRLYRTNGGMRIAALYEFPPLNATDEASMHRSEETALYP